MIVRSGTRPSVAKARSHSTAASQGNASVELTVSTAANQPQSVYKHVAAGAVNTQWGPAFPINAFYTYQGPADAVAPKQFRLLVTMSVGNADNTANFANEPIVTGELMADEFY